MKTCKHCKHAIPKMTSFECEIIKLHAYDGDVDIVDDVEDEPEYGHRPRLFIRTKNFGCVHHEEMDTPQEKKFGSEI